MSNYFLQYLNESLINEAEDANMNYVDNGDKNTRVKNAMQTLIDNAVFDAIISNNAISGAIGINISTKTVKAFEVDKLNGKEQKVTLDGITLSNDIFSNLEKNAPEYKSIKLEYTQKDKIWKCWFLPKESTGQTAKIAYKDGKFSNIQFGTMSNVNASNQNQSNQQNNSQQQTQQQQTQGQQQQ